MYEHFTAMLISVAEDVIVPDRAPVIFMPASTAPATSTSANAPMIARRRVLRVRRVERVVVAGVSGPMPEPCGV